MDLEVLRGSPSVAMRVLSFHEYQGISYDTAGFSFQAVGNASCPPPSGLLVYFTKLRALSSCWTGEGGGGGAQPRRSAQALCSP